MHIISLQGGNIIDVLEQRQLTNSELRMNQAIEAMASSLNR